MFGGVKWGREGEKVAMIARRRGKER